MRHILYVACLLTLLPVGQALAASEPQQAKAAEHKAESVEQKVATQGQQAPRSPAQTITKTEAQAVDRSGAKPLDDPITCLARTIYWEARSDGDGGMEAIANLVMNRLGHEGFPSTVCEVVKQGKEHGACQFSWWCEDRAHDAEEEKPYARAKEIAREALNGQLKDRTGGAMYFYHKGSKGSAPDWAKKYVRTAEVGDHIFYKPPHGNAK
jgi:spore germination cell wall hydrolase CwlJ-like protein